MLRCVDFLFLKRAGMGKKKQENFLDYVPKRNKLYEWDWNQKKHVEIAVVNRGLFNRIAQILFRKPKVSKIELDELGSFIWQEMDGARTVYELGEAVRTK